MNEPIPVSLAVRVVERAIRECDAATPGDWYETGGQIRSLWDHGGRNLYVMRAGDVEQGNVRFFLLGRAGFRASLEYLLDALRGMERQHPHLAWLLPHHRSAVAAESSHYDETAPGWRTE